MHLILGMARCSDSVTAFNVEIPGSDTLPIAVQWWQAIGSDSVIVIVTAHYLYRMGQGHIIGLPELCPGLDEAMPSQTLAQNNLLGLQTTCAQNTLHSEQLFLYIA